MYTTMNDVLHPGAAQSRDPDFPYAPEGWSKAETEATAKSMGLELSEDHWEAIRVLHGCYTDEATPRIRLICGALKARFRAKGGIGYVYELFPNGPLAQGCQLAGVKAPAGAVEGAEGSAA